MAVLRVRVTPRASKSEVSGHRDGVLLVRVTAPPAEGKANRELVKLLADWLGVKRGQISITSGRKARDKTVAVEGITQREVDALVS